MDWRYKFKGGLELSVSLLHFRRIKGESTDQWLCSFLCHSHSEEGGFDVLFNVGFRIIYSMLVLLVLFYLIN